MCIRFIYQIAATSAPSSSFSSEPYIQLKAPPLPAVLALTLALDLALEDGDPGAAIVPERVRVLRPPAPATSLLPRSLLLRGEPEAARAAAVAAAAVPALALPIDSACRGAHQSW